MIPIGKRDYETAAMATNVIVTIRERRHALGMTQEQVAERAGIHQEQVAKLEGGREPYLGTLVAVLWALDMHLILEPRQ